MITPGELRGRTQPTIILRMDSTVAAAPPAQVQVFEPGLYVFAQYIGNGRLLLTPVDPTAGFDSEVVMASALNSTATIINGSKLVLTPVEA